MAPRADGAGIGRVRAPGSDTGRVVQLVLVHDLVEIGAGDLHFDASSEQQAAQQSAEAAAAQRLFGSLPAAQATEFLALWQEFEANITPEARFARALDALQPMLLTWGEGGQGCRQSYPELTHTRVVALKEKHLREFPELWDAAREMLRRAEQRGLLAP
ncbi:HD family hydrolase [Deinococcus lacus]|uniref:HD family hydrolase n=1 Tax=Deinococcus lacus TaxID=392561 RepID=A0ABW1YB38_9DEIO